MEAWDKLTDLAFTIAADCEGVYRRVKEAADQAGQCLWLRVTDKKVATEPEGFGVDPLIPVKAAAWELRDLVRGPASALQFVPNSLNRLVGGPTPVASMLAGGLLGAGSGWLAGRLGEALAPEGTLEKGKLRRTAAILGGLLGAAPGAWSGTLGMRDPDPNWSSRWEAWIRPHRSLAGPVPEPLEKGALRSLADAVEAEDDFYKEADFAVEPFVPDIPVDQFNRVVWADPFTPQPIRAATTGLLDMASAAKGGVRLISPFDIARVALSAGSGAVSANLVGKTLGALAGLTPAAQGKLQSMGAWAGALSSIIPMAFGG